MPGAHVIQARCCQPVLSLSRERESYATDFQQDPTEQGYWQIPKNPPGYVGEIKNVVLCVIHWTRKATTSVKESQIRLNFPNLSRAFLALTTFPVSPDLSLMMLREVRYNAACKDHAGWLCPKNKAAPQPGRTTEVFPAITKGAFFTRKSSSPNSLQYE